jgi:hypothetical protein
LATRSTRPHSRSIHLSILTPQLNFAPSHTARGPRTASFSKCRNATPLALRRREILALLPGQAAPKGPSEHTPVGACHPKLATPTDLSTSKAHPPCPAALSPRRVPRPRPLRQPEAEQRRRRRERLDPQAARTRRARREAEELGPWARNPPQTTSLRARRGRPQSARPRAPRIVQEAA